jgi:hypothetical protein
MLAYRFALVLALALLLAPASATARSSAGPHIILKGVLTGPRGATCIASAAHPSGHCTLEAFDSVVLGAAGGNVALSGSYRWSWHGTVVELTTPAGFLLRATLPHAGWRTIAHGHGVVFAGASITLPKHSVTYVNAPDTPGVLVSLTNHTVQHDGQSGWRFELRGWLLARPG